MLYKFIWPLSLDPMTSIERLEAHIWEVSLAHRDVTAIDVPATYNKGKFSTLHSTNVDADE